MKRLVILIFLYSYGMEQPMELVLSHQRADSTPDLMPASIIIQCNESTDVLLKTLCQWFVPEPILHSFMEDNLKKKLTQMQCSGDIKDKVLLSSLTMLSRENKRLSQLRDSSDIVGSEINRALYSFVLNAMSETMLHKETQAKAHERFAQEQAQRYIHEHKRFKWSLIAHIATAVITGAAGACIAYFSTCS